jgi:hypothetical protein
MLQPGVYDIKLQRRADFSLLLTIEDSAGLPINLTGWTAVAQAWDSTRTTQYADFTIAYTNRVAGQITIGLTSAQTTTFPRESQYDLLLINPSGLKEYYLEGSVIASEGFSAA